ncbi:MAG: hypothetical protein RL151_1316, partial [Bacteroidota bacterium]
PICAVIFADDDLEWEIRLLAEYTVETLRDEISMLVGCNPYADHGIGYAHANLILPFVGKVDSFLYFLQGDLTH